MALIKCAECGKEISDKAAACIGCGAPINPTPHRTEPQAKREPSALAKSLGYGESKGEEQYGNIFPDMQQKAPQSKAAQVIGWGLTIATVALIGSCMFGSRGKSSSNGISDSRALSLCKEGIRLVSRDPDKAQIPYAESERIGPDYVFTWTNGTNTIRLRNGFGLEVPASARCSVNAALGKISSLTVNGNTIISQ
ncbi:zinc-ribbon domain-containing protein [Delftia sp. DT-2]|uniref:zinc-ribbon domain-containing protein n=1 Tax=Delftia sp. DT-2 TaxID=3022772 RepID=UPI00233F3521|nr:hypothetical protein [Delftia sp. DT-2]MDC2858609.1 hypothetical protein [Delftia sp. DT-2]